MAADSDIDFLDEIIEERKAKTPEFSAMVDEAYERRLLLRQTAEARKTTGLTRTIGVARVGTSGTGKRR